eukprot:8225836-Pyramimonas_sp.AAC.1
MATCDLVCRYAATAWEKRAPLRQLHHAWAAIATKMVGEGKTSWREARGPIACAVVNIWRID